VLSSEPNTSRVRHSWAHRGGGLKNAKWPFFRLKVHFSQRKSATEFLCVKTVSGTVVRHSLAYLSVQKWLVGEGDVPFHVKICGGGGSKTQSDRFLFKIWTLICVNFLTVYEIYQLVLITNKKSHTALDWYRHRWPWMNLNGVIALILRYFNRIQ